MAFRKNTKGFTMAQMQDLCEILPADLIQPAELILPAEPIQPADLDLFEKLPKSAVTIYIWHKLVLCDWG